MAHIISKPKRKYKKKPKNAAAPAAALEGDAKLNLPQASTLVEGLAGPDSEKVKRPKSKKPKNAAAPAAASGGDAKLNLPQASTLVEGLAGPDSEKVKRPKSKKPKNAAAPAAASGGDANLPQASTLANPASPQSRAAVPQPSASEGNDADKDIETRWTRLAKSSAMPAVLLFFYEVS
jgi:hypothetical protein